MAEFDLNLSTRPFPAYRLINLALAILLVVLVVVSLWQAVGFLRYSSMAGGIRANERNARAEAEALGRRAAEFESRLDRPEATAKLAEIGFINSLIMRKEFSWTKMFGNLEDIVPENVHLISLTPSFAPTGVIAMNMSVQGRSIADVTEFVDRLERSPVFTDVKVTVEEKQSSTTPDVNITLTANYYPQRDVK